METNYPDDKTNMITLNTEPSSLMDSNITRSQMMFASTIIKKDSDYSNELLKTDNKKLQGNFENNKISQDEKKDEQQMALGEIFGLKKNDMQLDSHVFTEEDSIDDVMKTESSYFESSDESDNSDEGFNRRKQKVPFYILLPEDCLRLILDFILVIAILYTVIISPLKMAVPDAFSKTWNYIDITTDAFF